MCCAQSFGHELIHIDTELIAESNIYNPHLIYSHWIYCFWIWDYYLQPVCLLSSNPAHRKQCLISDVHATIVCFHTRAHTTSSAMDGCEVAKMQINLKKWCKESDNCFKIVLNMFNCDKSKSKRRKCSYVTFDSIIGSHEKSGCRFTNFDAKQKERENTNSEPNNSSAKHLQLICRCSEKQVMQISCVTHSNLSWQSMHTCRCAAIQYRKSRVCQEVLSTRYTINGSKQIFKPNARLNSICSKINRT